MTKKVRSGAVAALCGALFATLGAAAEPGALAASTPPKTDAVGDQVKSFPFRGAAFAVDASRNRVYVASPTNNTVEVIDGQTLGIVASVPVGISPRGLSIAPDGRRLYTANSGSSATAISVVDLDALTALSPIALNLPALDVAAGLGGRLYVALSTTNSFTPNMVQVDIATGAATAFPIDSPGSSQSTATTVRITPDRATLVTAYAVFSDPARRWDVSGTTPVYSGQSSTAYNATNQTDLVISPNGRFFVNLYGTGNAPAYKTTLFSVASPGGVLGTFDTSGYPTCAAFSPDSSLAYIHYDVFTHEVRPYSTSTFAPAGTGIRVQGVAQRLTFDATGRYLFAAEGEGSGPSFVRVYATGPTTSSRLVNVSTRLRVEVGDNVGIGGFVVSGNGSKRVVARALGPSLGASGVAGTLADPVLELRDSSGALVAANDNWADTQAADLAATGLAPTRSSEAAIVATLLPGAYTAIVRGAGLSSGVALIEVYDVDGQTTPRAINISTRGRVQTGDDVMIAGFVVTSAEKRVLVQVLGPSLAGAGISGTLADPTVELRNASGALVAQNDDWQSTQSAEIRATGRAPANPREAAMIVTLPAGAYTAIVRGVGNSTGVALVEVYDLD